MPRIVIKQPNGKYAVFSSIVDDFIIVDADKQELIDSDIEEARERITEKYDEMFRYFDKGEVAPRYRHSQMTWEEALEIITARHGEDAAKESEVAALGE